MTRGNTQRMYGVLAGLALTLTAAYAATPPNPEAHKPEVVANWDKLPDRVKTDIAKYEPYLYRKLSAYWTDKAPVLDGKLDDPCWADADVAKDFIREDSLVKELKPSDYPTEVRVCYDAAYLYVAYRLYDRAMDKLALGQPQDWRDILDPKGDQLEFFLDPTLGDDRTKRDQSDNRLFQLGVNPRGATYDARGYGGLEWNPDWDVKTAILKDCWIVEARIPFRCLSFPGEPTATPQTGDVWGALFCRDHAVPQEWSRWTTSAVGGLAGFHNLQSFGRLVFLGRKDKKEMPVVRTDRTRRLAFGRNEWVFDLKGEIDHGLFELVRQGKSVVKTKLKSAATVRVPFDLTDGGDLLARVTFSRKGAEVYRLEVEGKLPLAFAFLDGLRRDVRELTGRLSTMPAALTAQLLTQCRRFDQEATKLKGVFSAGTVGNADLDAFTQLSRDWRAFRFDAGRIELYPAKAAATVPFTAVAVEAYTKLFPGQIPAAAERATDVRLAAAGNDRESFQLLIVPFWTDLGSVQISVQPLTSGTASIAPASVDCFQVGIAQHDPQYRKTLPGYDPDDPDSRRDWPDVLVPITGSAVKATADQATVLWFDVLCPAGTTAGAYRGAVTLTANGYTLNVPVTLTAAGFDIPRFSTLRHNSWLDYHYRRVFHGPEFAQKIDTLDGFLAIYESDLKLLDKYRMGQFPFGPQSWNWIKAWLEPDGRYTFDFSGLARVLRLGRQYGANWFPASFGCNPGGVIPIGNGTLPVTERATGKVLALRECPNLKALYEKPPQDQWAAIYANQAYRDFLPQFVTFLRDMGLLEYSYFEQHDESKPAIYVPAHRTLREIAPGMPLMNEGPTPQDESLGMRGIGYNDRWEPGLGVFDEPDMLRVLRERRQKYGETYGFYVCGAMERADNRCTPYIKISQPTTAPRILGWFAWKHDIDHMLVFMQFAGMPKKGWTLAQPPMSEFPGYSPLTYPGPAPEFSLIPSIRMATLRDGLEDYEYFRLLQKLTAYLDDKYAPHKSLLERATAELVIEPEICRTDLEWTSDAGKLAAKRAKIVQLIQQVQAQIAAYPEAVTKTKP